MARRSAPRKLGSARRRRRSGRVASTSGVGSSSIESWISFGSGTAVLWAKLGSDFTGTELQARRAPATGSPSAPPVDPTAATRRRRSRGRGRSSAAATPGSGRRGRWPRRSPECRVLLLEADTCGAGPSGRNAGFVNGFWQRADLLCEQFGDGAAREVCVARGRVGRGDRRLGGVARGRHRLPARRSPEGRRRAPPRTGPGRRASRACARLGVGRRVRAGRPRPRSAGAATRRSSAAAPGCAGAATVQPARLALALRAALLARGRARSASARRARRIGARAATAASLVETATGAGAGALGGRSPSTPRPPGSGRCASQLAVSSTHMIVTEPVPDLLAEIGWDGRRGDLDRAPVPPLLPDHRRRPDRVRLGAAEARLRRPARRPGRGRRRGRRPSCAIEIARFFPGLRGRRIDAAWGGPVDVSPTHLPCVGTVWRRPDPLRLRVHRQRGRPRAPGRPDPRRRSPSTVATSSPGWRSSSRSQPPVPPEPLRWLGGSAVRSALLRKEAREDAGCPAARSRSS